MQKQPITTEEEFNDYASDMLDSFLDGIENLPNYTYPATGENPTLEYEENIQWYYTSEGMNLVERWHKRVGAIFLKYFPDGHFRPWSSKYKEF